MIIENNKVVSFRYKIKEAGVELENNYENDCVVYLHGQNGMLPGVEKALTGKTQGDSLAITLTPEEAYGERRSSSQERISIKRIRLPGQRPVKNRLAPGTLIEVKTDHGIIEATVIKMGMNVVEVDTNHPFAGKTLDFDIKIEDVRAATADEIAHGHVHGVGGHHH